MDMYSMSDVYIDDGDMVVYDKIEILSKDEISYPIDTVVLGSTIYRDVITFDSDYFLSASQKLESERDIKRYVIAKNEGLVMYETADGEMFVKQPAEKHPFVPQKLHWWYGLFFGFRYYIYN